jgi:signal transduction histidine kinase
VPAVLPLNESSRELIVEVARALEPYYPDITAAWRERLSSELGFHGRVLAALERLNISAGSSYFPHHDFNAFFENVTYFGTRLAKLEVDTRFVARSLELYSLTSEPYLGSLFGERDSEARAALEMLSSATFIAVSGAYFDTKTKETAALLAALEAELSASDTTALLQRVLETTASTFGAAAGAIAMREPDSDEFRLAASVGMNPGEEYRFRVGEGFAGGIAARGEPEAVLDPMHDRRILNDTLRNLSRSIWGVPMKADGRVMGVIVIGFNKPYEWLPTERALMHAIADRSAMAIDRVRINEALREREARIAELSGHLLQVQEDERKRISRELHDDTGQSLMVIRLYLGMLEQGTSSRLARNKIRETLNVVDRTIEGLRRMIARLSPLVLQELGLIAAIRKAAKDLAKSTGVKVRVAVADEVGRLPSETEAAIYRVVQEALHNVAKHAHARNVNIHMSREGGGVRLSVEDDGVGMERRSSSRGKSFGLAGIKERVGMLGGELRLQSSKGKGTRIEVTVPAGEPAVAAALAAEGTTNAKDQMPVG